MYTDNICYVISNLWHKREEHINTDYAVTGWVLCVIPHIRDDVFKNSQNKHHIQVSNVIKNLFAGSTEKELHVLKLPCKLQTQELWWMVMSISDAIDDYYHQ